MYSTDSAWRCDGEVFWEQKYRMKYLAAFLLIELRALICIRAADIAERSMQ